MATTIEINGVVYRTYRRLSALQQFHVSRRLAPILAVVGIKAADLSRAAAQDGADLSSFMGMLPHMAEVLSKMPDDEAEYIIFTCLAVVQRQQGEDMWAAVTPPDGSHQLMFSDMEMDAMVRLVVAVVQENLAGFLPGLGGATPSPSP